MSCIFNICFPQKSYHQDEPKINIKTRIPFEDAIDKGFDDITWEMTKPFIPPVTCGKVIKVYDGDTITIASRLPYVNSPIYRFSVRLLGIDSAEIKGKTIVEKATAIVARDALASKIYGKMVTLKNVTLEKYGRVLADVYLDDLCVNQWMLDEGYAVKYDGGTKNRPIEWSELAKDD